MIPERARFTGIDLFVIIVLCCGIGWLATSSRSSFNYSWNWGAIPQFLFRHDVPTDKWMPGTLMKGLFTTLRVSFWATVSALVLGTVAALFKTGRSRFLKMMGTGYVETIRNIPVLVWIFIAYYFIGDRLVPADIRWPSADHGSFLKTLMDVLVGNPSQFPVFLAGTAALAIYEGAYVTEIIRAGIQAIDPGQWEASSALGFSRLQQMRHIILPQALKRMLPPLAGQVISTVKDSAIVSVISIQELTFQGMELMAATFLTFEIWITIMVMYFVICFLCSLGVNAIENHYNRA